ncbi:hypothetical protein CU633_02990, partial [Bacillus sp. V3-13]|uniref:hypothetical protein n=1 Tax=Bacillus sp. V3-13 TaxID=2053728 RepID=UPI000C7560EA
MQGSPQMAQNVQSIVQPGFGTNPQQVRQDIARDLAYGSQQQGGMMAGGLQGGMMAGGLDGSYQMAGGMMDGSAPIRRGMQGSSLMAQNAQSIVQPGFGTNPQQVRQDIARDLAYGSQQQQGGMMAGGLQGGMMAGGLDGSYQMAGGMMDGSAPLRRGMQGTWQMGQNAQSIVQPGFGTNPQQVRQDIARDLAYGSQQQQGAGMQMYGLGSLS